MFFSARPCDGHHPNVDFDCLGEGVEITGTPDKVGVDDTGYFGDFIAGLEVTGVGDGQHDGRPATLIKLSIFDTDTDRTHEVGRLVVRNDLPSSSALQWERIFEPDGAAAEFVKKFESGELNVAPKGYKRVKARQVDKGDVVLTGDGPEEVALVALDHALKFEAPDGTYCPSEIAVHVVTENEGLDDWFDADATLVVKES